MVGPTRRKIWWSEEAKNYWQDKFINVEQMLHDLELLSVREGKRAVCTRHINPSRLPERQGELIDQGLTFLPLKRVGNYSGFAHGHPQPKAGDWNYYGVIGRNKSDCRKFQEASSEGDHDAIGKLLGFPKEAREFFQENFSMKDSPDPIYDIEREDGEVVRPSYLTNIGLRYFGFRLITFFPSSWKSDKAKEFGKMFVELAKDHLNGKTLDDMKKVLKMPYILSSLHGVIQAWTPLFQGIANTGYRANEERIIVIPQDMELPKYSKVPRDLREYI